MSDFDFSTLITDRTAADVSKLDTLLKKPMAMWTAEETAEFNAAVVKGGYDYTDLNRVTAAMEALDAALRQYGYSTGYRRIRIDHGTAGGGNGLPDGYSSPYTWYESDAQTESLMAQYLANVLTVCNTILSDPELPTTMEKLTYQGANQIEQALVTLNTAIEQIVQGFMRSNSFAFWSGNRPFPSAKSDRGRTWAELDAMQTGWRNWQAANWYLLLYGNLKAEGVVE